MLLEAFAKLQKESVGQSGLSNQIVGAGVGHKLISHIHIFVISSDGVMWKDFYI